MRLEHIAFNVREPAALATWYCAHLGMQVLRSSDEAPYIHFLADSADKSVIEVYCNPRGIFHPHRDMHPVTFHLAFAVQDIAAAEQRLLAAGAEAASELEETASGDQLLFMRDPWGHAIQLVQRQQPLLDTEP